MSLETSGLLHGVPITTGPNSFTSLKATDVNGAVGTRLFSLEVNDTPSITSPFLCPTQGPALAYCRRSRLPGGTPPFTWM